QHALQPKSQATCQGGCEEIRQKRPMVAVLNERAACPERSLQERRQLSAGAARWHGAGRYSDNGDGEQQDSGDEGVLPWLQHEQYGAEHDERASDEPGDQPWSFKTGNPDTPLRYRHHAESGRQR
ncbi:MAG: hypothetical protein JWO22_863, partial [Frankiales bacterium]|nr:hypothetical protein [Frankiales bacterium]